ncbi:MAG: RES family NAD+ phosphorylase [Gemmatimonas sp.]
MSSNIWTQCAGASRTQSLALTAWRVVEAQHQLATRKLVDSAEEQMLLEELIASSKPPAVVAQRLHYLLSTPFRYPPLRHGSRFGGRFETGIWYGSERVETSLAEVAYYRFVLLQGTTAKLGMLSASPTAFNVNVRSDSAIDLTETPFAEHEREISSPVQYTASQTLGAAMRGDGVELCRYVSARARDRGINVALFSPSVFGKAKPRGFETWQLVSTPDVVELSKRDYFARERLVFRREEFLVDGELPAPAV